MYEYVYEECQDFRFEATERIQRPIFAMDCIQTQLLQELGASMLGP